MVLVGLVGFWKPGLAQTSIPLEQCDVPYFDPQNTDDDTVPGRDTLLFTDYFSEDTLLKAFHVDINAFGGQQVDRAPHHGERAALRQRGARRTAR